jgi:signal transduction histidine kinase
LLLDIERTEDLATRMLALARLEEAPVEVAEASSLASAVNTVTGRVHPLAGLKQIELTATADGDASVAMSPDDAEVLCSNLLMNAIQHTAERGHISLKLESSGGHAVLRVIDNGEGIPASALPHIFERFYRADRSRSRQSGGAGLGLSICKALVNRANGSIEVKSRIGAGTEVIVKLPLTSATTEPRPEATAAANTA